MVQSRQKALGDLQSLQNDKVYDAYMTLTFFFFIFLFPYSHEVDEGMQGLDIINVMHLFFTTLKNKATSVHQSKISNRLVQIFRQLEKLSDIQSQPESQLKFIIEAWLQVLLHYCLAQFSFITSLCCSRMTALISMFRLSNVEGY